GKVADIVQLLPSYDGAVELARMLAAQRLLEEAVASSQEALRRRPDHVPLKVFLSVALNYSGGGKESKAAVDEALAALSQQLQAGPLTRQQYRDALMTRGRLYRNSGKDKEALADF